MKIAQEDHHLQNLQSHMHINNKGFKTAITSAAVANVNRMYIRQVQQENKK
jgi:hypothetical protein